MKYITLEEVMAIHDHMVSEYGGSKGLRDLNLLESALFRPQSSFGGEELYPDLYSKGASLLHSLVSNHPFIDGNKRTSFVCLSRFFYLNGVEIIANDNLVYSLILSIAESKVDVTYISDWLKKHSRKL